MTSDAQTPQEYLDAMIAARGYVLPYHRALIEHDLPVMVAMNGVVESAYTSQRRLSAREKELIFIVSLTVLRADSAHIESHIDKAMRLGVDPADILQAIEIALPEAGVVAFQHGVEAWLRSTSRTVPPPSEPAAESGSDPTPERDA